MKKINNYKYGIFSYFKLGKTKNNNLINLMKNKQFD